METSSLYNRTLDTTAQRKQTAMHEAIFAALFVLFMLLKAFYFQYVNQIFLKLRFLPHDLMAIIANLSLLLILLSLFMILPAKWRHIPLVSANLALSVLLLADTLYFRYYNSPVTIPVLYQIGLLGSLGESIWNLLRPSDLIYLLDIPFLGLWAVRRRRKSYPGFPAMLRIALCLALILAGSMLFTQAVRKANVRQFRFDRNYIIKHMGIYYFHCHDIKNFVAQVAKKDDPPSSEEFEQIRAFLEGKEAGGKEYKGFAAGSNLIVLQLESIQSFVINSRIEGREITPNLNRLVRNSLYFENFYCQIGGGNTSDAEFMTNNSLYPLKEGAVYFQYPFNRYHSLPSLLKKQGYRADVFHAYEASFWNRNEMYLSTGFDRFYSNKDFKQAGKKGWGLGDEEFLKQSLDMMDISAPFYSFLITLSSHYPYGAFAEDSFDVGKYEGSTLGNYFKAAHYVDHCIGLFVKEMKSKGIWENTLLVIYGDHSSMPRYESAELRRYLGIDNSESSWIKNQKVPCIIHYPGLRNGEVINKAAGQMDLLPTIANLMNLDAPYAIGKDMLNMEKGYAVFRDGSFITDNYVYVSSADEAYSLESGQPLPRQEYEKDLEKYQHQLYISDLILEKDALKFLK